MTRVYGWVAKTLLCVAYAICLHGAAAQTLGLRLCYFFRRIRVDTATNRIVIHDPINGTQAQYSIAFAEALVNADAAIFQYPDEMLAAPRIRAMMKTIHIELDQALDRDYPDKRASWAEVVLADGWRFEGHIDIAKGEPEGPAGAAEIEYKFLALARRVLPKSGTPVTA